MDNLLNDVGDLDIFLDLPNDILLDDLDSLDFINDIDDNSLYDCDLDILKTSSGINELRSNAGIQYSDYKIVPNIVSQNYYRGSVSNDLPPVSRNAASYIERCQPGQSMVRDLLSSDIGTRTSVYDGSLLHVDRHININKHHSHNNGVVLNIRPNDQKTIIPKHPIILPATTPSAGQLIRTPTLAATLISIQPSCNSDTQDGDTSSFGSGKVVRRNSHNAIEKRYRLSINDRIDELRHMLALGDNSKMNKSAVLRKAVERIRSLEQENSSLKCENYNLRKSIVNTSSNESLNQTGSSPLSNHSEGAHSITNSPSSSSMNSTSVASSFLFFKNNEKQPCLINNLSKGVKRPLIYDNSSTTVKTEKLARLLLSSSDSYEDKGSGLMNEIQRDHDRSIRLHSSNMPSFLLCTMALFVVAFQPLEIVLNNYRVKSVTTTGGRRILQHLDMSDTLITDLGRTVILTMVHWLLAFMLVWGSTKNRILLTKMFSLLIKKVWSSVCISFGNCDECNDGEVDIVEKNLVLWHQEPHTFNSKLKGCLKDYQCECPSNIIMFFVQLLAVLCCIVVSFIPFNWTKPRRSKGRHLITLRLLSCVVEQSLICGHFSRLQVLWYKALLVLTIRYCDCDERTTLAKLFMLQSIPIDFVRKYFINKSLGSSPPQLDSLPDRYRSLLTSPDIQKLFIKNSFQRIRERCEANCLMMPLTSECADLYHMAHVQDSVTSVIQKIRTHESDLHTVDILKEVMRISPSILTEGKSRYVNKLCDFIMSIEDGSKHKNMADIAADLIDCYSRMITDSVEDTTKNAIKQIVRVLRLFVSTTGLLSGHDDHAHELNLDLISLITKWPITNLVTGLIFDLSLSNIRGALCGQPPSLSGHSAHIYYAGLYNTMLRDYADRQSAGCGTMLSEFDVLFQNLCQVNPIKCGFPKIENRDHRKTDISLCRVTEFVSSERTRLAEYNKSKMRSH